MNNRKWIVVAVAALIVGVGLGYALLIVAAGLTLWSMTNYLMAAWPHLSTTEKK